MNQTTFNSHLAAIDAGTAAKHALFVRANHIWGLAQAILGEYESRFHDAFGGPWNADDRLDSLREDTIFAYSDRRPASISLDGKTQMVTLRLQQPYGERWTDPISFPYSWLTMTDDELTVHFKGILDDWLKQAQDRKAEQERQDESNRRAQYESLKAEFGPSATP